MLKCKNMLKRKNMLKYKTRNPQGAFKELALKGVVKKWILIEIIIAFKENQAIRGLSEIIFTEVFSLKLCPLKCFAAHAAHAAKSPRWSVKSLLKCLYKGKKTLTVLLYLCLEPPLYGTLLFESNYSCKESNSRKLWLA